MTEDDIRKELIRLTQLLVIEGTRVSAASAAAHGLHPTDVEALTRLLVADERQEPMTASRLGKDLSLTSGAITFLVDRLERAGHITRERDTGDRRKVLLHHSANGRAIAEDFFDRFGHQSDTTADQFTSAELEIVHRYLTTVTTGMIKVRQSITPTAT